jgi:hypothetical protein
MEKRDGIAGMLFDFQPMNKINKADEHLSRRKLLTSQGRSQPANTT